MDKLLLSIVVVSGLCAVSSAPDRGYHVVYERKTMTEAQRYCREKHIDLVTIRGPEDLETLKGLVDSSRMVDNRAWIGLYTDNWRWSLSNTSLYKPEELEFRRWRSEEPNQRKIEREQCGLINPNEVWSATTCDWNRRPLCFDDRGPNKTFVFINSNMYWHQAQSYCRQHHTDLAMVSNIEENQKLFSVSPGGDAFWIGLFRDGWKWSDGSDSTFANWKALEPRGLSENCVTVDFSAGGQWVDVDCNSKSAFICYSAPVAMRVIKVRLQKSSSLDLNDPVVKENLLKQLKLKLKAQGLNDDVKLSWKKQADGKVFHKEEKKTGKKRRDEL